MRFTIANLLAFNAAWFACVLGAGHGLPWLGPLAVLVSAGLHLIVLPRKCGLVLVYLCAFMLGWVADFAVVQAGALDFPDHARLWGPVPIWMAFMWVNFATTLHVSLRWLRGRYVLAGIFGLLGGPGAYYTGMRLDAVLLPEPLSISLLIIGLEWAVSMVALVWVAQRLRPDIKPDSSVDPAAGASPRKGTP